MAFTSHALAAPSATAARPERSHAGAHAEVAPRTGATITPRDRQDPLATALARSVSQRGPLLQRSFFDDLLDAVTGVVEAARAGPALMTVRLFIKGGSTDENYLTNIAFWFVHPEIQGMKLRPNEVPEHKPLVEQWLAIRDQLVRPELTKAKATHPPAEEPSPPAPAPAPAPPRPAPAPAPAGKLDSKRFLTDHRDLLAQLGATDDELLMLLDDTLKERSAVRLEYNSYSKAKKPIPLTQKLFMKRNPTVDVVELVGATPLKDYKKQADKAGGWAKLGVTEAQWSEIAGIRDKIVYPFLRIVLPRIESAGTLGANATDGEKIAHRAHAYLGVRYSMGGRYEEKLPKGQKPDPANKRDPLQADPSKETGATLDCASLVRLVLADLKLTVKNGAGTENGGAASPLRNSPDVEEVDAGSLLPGDLLFRPRYEDGKVAGEHVGILVDSSWLIEAPHTGRVVSKTPFQADKWTWFRRRKPK